MARPARVAAVQFRPDQRDVGASRAALLALADEAAVDADLVVLPEMAVPGYLFDDAAAVRAIAERPDGPTGAALAALAAARSVWLVAGFAEDAGEVLYNSAWVFDPAGACRAVYRKTLLFEADTVWAACGTGDYPAFDTPFGRIGVGICMDLNDPAFVRWVAQARIDVLAFPTNWLDEGEDVWGYWAWRLAGTRAALVAANRWGVERGVGFRGQSAVLRGRTILAHTGREGDDIVRATVAAIGASVVAG